MKKIKLDLFRKKNQKSTGSKPVNFRTKKSEEIDEFFLQVGTVINVFARSDKEIGKKFYHDAQNIIYLPSAYVDMLRDFIIGMYSKTKDPIITGFMSKSNLDYTMEYVKVIYEDIPTREKKLLKKAAFIFYNLISKHPFTDGNKRTAVIACNSFLEYNGYTVGTLPFRKAKKFITEIAMGKRNEKACQNFLRKHLSRLIVSKKTEQELRKIYERTKLLKFKK